MKFKDIWPPIYIVPLLVIIIIIFMVIFVPRPIRTEWYWEKDYSCRVDSFYYEKKYFKDGDYYKNMYCVASNDTLYVLYPYSGTELKKFRTVIDVYQQTNDDFWDWYFHPLNPINPLSPLSPLNPINTD